MLKSKRFIADTKTLFNVINKEFIQASPRWNVSRQPRIFGTARTGCVLCRCETESQYTTITFAKYNTRSAAYSRQYSYKGPLVQNANRKLMQCMETFQIKKGIALLTDCIEKNEAMPSGSTIVNFIQQLGNLGEVDAMMHLKDKILEAKICSSDTFYPSLFNAYRNSGRIEEGIDCVKLMYHPKRDFKKIETFFVHLASSIIQDFPDSLPKILEFVNNCKLSSDYLPLACLWKCFIYCQDFEQADSLISKPTDQSDKESARVIQEMLDSIPDVRSESERSKDVANSEQEVQLDPFLRNAVNDIIMNRDKIEHDKICVLTHLSEKPFLKIRLQAQLFASLLTLLEAEGHNEEIEKLINRASELGLEERILKIVNG